MKIIKATIALIATMPVLSTVIIFPVLLLNYTNAFSQSQLQRSQNDALLRVYPLRTRSSLNQSISSNINDDYGTSKKEEDQNKEECPFSMTFPMYRIPISGGKEPKGSSSAGLFSGLFTGIVSSVKKSGFEKYASQKYNIDSKIAWYDPQETLAASSINGADDKNISDEKVKQGKIGIHVSAFVWRELSNLLYDMTQVEEAPLNSSKRVVVGVANTSLIGLKQLADIINWMNNEDGHDEKKEFYHQRENNTNDIRIQAEVDENSPVPTIVLEAKYQQKAEGTTSFVEQQQSPNVSRHLNDKIVTEHTKSWVKRLLVNMKICPFTKSTTKSGQGLGDVGVPVGRIAYHYSEAFQYQLPMLMADTWEAISNMISAGPSGKNGVSSILLSAPEFDNDFPLWAGPVFAMLEANVSAAKAEQVIGIVCFHPFYRTPDGHSWPGFGHMHSVPRLCKWVEENDKELFDMVEKGEISAGGAFQRRTPHATINVLRAEQLEAAEGRRSTGSLYSVNIRRLYEEGFDKLNDDLNLERSLTSNT